MQFKSMRFKCNYTVLFHLHEIFKAVKLTETEGRMVVARGLKVKAAQLHQTFVTPWAVAHQAPLFMEFSRKNTGRGLPFPSPGDIPDPEIKPRSLSLYADSLLSEPAGKPKNIGVGSLSLLQGNFPTQGSNHGLLHCR